MSSTPKFIPIIALIGAGFLGLGIYYVVNMAPAHQAAVGITETRPSQDTTEVVLIGKDDGVRLGTLDPEQTGVITYLSGRIISNTKNGYTAPIWGLPKSALTVL